MLQHAANGRSALALLACVQNGRMRGRRVSAWIHQKSQIPVLMELLWKRPQHWYLRSGTPKSLPDRSQIADTSAVGDPGGAPTALVSVIWEQTSLPNPPQTQIQMLMELLWKRPQN